MRPIVFPILIILLMAFCVGCSGDVSNVFIANDIPLVESETSSHHALWGMWNIGFDENEAAVTIVPLRNAEAHYDITPMLQPPACDDCLGIEVNSFDPVTRILDVDITLRNPYTINGYDVRGILYTNDFGHLLKNADDWTGLFDILGGQSINPFKAFAKDETNRMFAGESEHIEKYLIYIPLPPHYNYITYAVTASWPGNCKEPYEITNFWQETIYSAAGSTGQFYIDVRDWQLDVSQVILAASEITGEELTQFSHWGGDTWQITLVNNTGAVPGKYEAWIIAKSFNAGETSLYDYIDITISQDPNSGWARTWGPGGVFGLAVGEGVAIDGNSNFYVTGEFNNTVDFDPGPGIDKHTSNGSYDVFLSKFDAAGGFQWVRTWGGSDTEDGYTVTIDENGNACVTGRFNQTVDFDTGPGVDEHISNGDYDIFLNKFDSSGGFLWARTWGGAGYDSGVGVDIDESGNVYITGLFEYAVDFNPGSGVDEHTSKGDLDAFLSKFDSSGDFQWACTWGWYDLDGASRVAIDGSDNSFVTGLFGGTVDFDTGPGIDEHISNGDVDIFLSKFDSNGYFLWAHTWGGEGFDYGQDTALDDSGNVYITGGFNNTVDFDPGPGVDGHASLGMSDPFLSKFDSSGDFLWARTWGGIDEDAGNGVVADGSDNVYVTGDFGSTVDFNPGLEIDEHTSNGWVDIFLSKLDSNGYFLWAQAVGSSNVDRSHDVAIDVNGNAYITGYFADTIDFDPGPGIDEHTPKGATSAFLSKFPPDGDW